VFVKQDANFSITQKACQGGLAFEKRASAQILAIMLDKVERVENRGSSERDNSSNRDKPSGPTTTASPSIVKLSALIPSAAAAIAASRSVQSYALRL
jgi:hypothetical protein